MLVPEKVADGAVWAAAHASFMKKPAPLLAVHSLFMTENQQFHSFIMITMILTATHDSAIGGTRFWEYFRGRGSLVR
jgi:hypothetical protein